MPRLFSFGGQDPDAKRDAQSKAVSRPKPITSLHAGLVPNAQLTQPSAEQETGGLRLPVKAALPSRTGASAWRMAQNAGTY